MALLAAACQPLPPVMEREKASALLALADSVGVEVGRIEGAPPELEDRLRKRVEEALQRRGLPASRQEGNRLSYRLTGRVELAAMPDGHGPAAFDWELRAWDGEIAARFDHRLDGAQNDALAAHLEELTEGVARAIRAERKDEGPPLRLKVSIAPIAGAGAGATAPLVRALETALAGQGLDVVPRASPSHLHVFGNAEVGPVHAGLRELRLGWIVKWSDGQEVGTVDQANVVPAEWLAGDWTPIAAAAAGGAASGISDLVFKAQMDVRRTDADAARSRP